MDQKINSVIAVNDAPSSRVLSPLGTQDSKHFSNKTRQETYHLDFVAMLGELRSKANMNSTEDLLVSECRSNHLQLSNLNAFFSLEEASK